MSRGDQDKRRLKEDIKRSINVIGIETEEIFGCLHEENSLGDNGVAEAVIRIENAVSYIRMKLWPGEEVE